MSEEEVVAQKLDTIPEYKSALAKLLNVVAVFLSVILILVIYLPNSIWKEEESVRNLTRKRMAILNEVEKFYYQMAEIYQPDPLLAMKVVNAARDSTRADSNFFGEQVIKLPEGKFSLNVPKNFYPYFDTTFAVSYQKKDTVIDTTYRILKWNPELMTNDTLFVLAERVRQMQQSDSLFRKVLDFEVSTRVQDNLYYRPFFLDSSFAYNPLINKVFNVEVDSNKIIIRDPLKEVYKEPRYIFFAFKDSSAGYIENGEKSWKD